MAWNEAVVTNDGLELLAKCVLGESVEITSAVGGETVSPAVSLMAIKEIAEPKHDLNIAKTERIKNGITVNVRTQNNGLSEGYCLRQIGLFARLEGSEAAPVLLAVIQDKDGEFVPKEEENPEYLLEYDFVIPVNNAENISVSVSPNTFATLEDIREMSGHINDKSNPHAVTKTQVGLGNVPNVVTNDQTPTYSESAGVSNLTSGEKLSAALGKIAKAVRELISHIGDNVKHVTAAERGAWNGKAAGSHTHDDRYYTESETDSKLAGKAASNHSHTAASASAAGFMSAADKSKLDGITAGANKYIHPTTAGNKHIPPGGSSGQILRWSADGTAAWGADNNTTYGVASQSANGLMSAADKKKLDGVAAGANVYAHPVYTARTGVPTANQTPAFGGTFSITQPVSDGSGHITGMNSRTVKIPNNVASGSAAGLMSASDKSKLNEIKVSGINVTYGKETISKATTGPISKTVTISHKTDIVFLWVLNNATYRTVIVLNSYANSEMLAGGFTVRLSQSTNSAALEFTGGSNLDETVYYAAFRMS